jgi:hypothetical protein
LNARIKIKKKGCHDMEERALKNVAKNGSVKGVPNHIFQGGVWGVGGNQPKSNTTTRIMARQPANITPNPTPTCKISEHITTFD